MTVKRRLKNLEQNQHQDEVYCVRVSWRAEGEPEPPAEDVELLVVVNGNKERMSLAEFRRRFPHIQEKTITIDWKDV